MIIAALVMGMSLPMAAQTEKQVNADAENAVQEQVIDSASIEMKRLELKELEMKQQHQADLYRIKHGGGFNFEYLIPIGICVVLPLAIVGIVFFSVRKREREQADLLKLMIEKGQDVTPFIEAQKKPKTSNESLTGKLIWGFVCALGGLGLTIYSFMREDDLLVFALPLVGIGIALIVGTLIARKWKKEKEGRIELNEPEK